MGNSVDRGDVCKISADLSVLVSEYGYHTDVSRMINFIYRFSKLDKYFM